MRGTRSRRVLHVGRGTWNGARLSPSSRSPGFPGLPAGSVKQCRALLTAESCAHGAQRRRWSPYLELAESQGGEPQGHQGRLLAFEWEYEVSATRCPSPAGAALTLSLLVCESASGANELVSHTPQRLTGTSRGH